MQKKLLILLLALLISGLYTGCTSGVLPGTDEPQPDPTPTITKRVVMLELFVGPSCTRCAKIHPDIVRLRQEYGFDELVNEALDEAEERGQSQNDDSQNVENSHKRVLLPKKIPALRRAEYKRRSEACQIIQWRANRKIPGSAVFPYFY